MGLFGDILVDFRRGTTQNKYFLIHMVRSNVGYIEPMTIWHPIFHTVILAASREICMKLPFSIELKKKKSTNHDMLHTKRSVNIPGMTMQNKIMLITEND